MEFWISLTKALLITSILAKSYPIRLYLKTSEVINVHIKEIIEWHKYLL